MRRRSVACEVRSDLVCPGSAAPLARFVNATGSISVANCTACDVVSFTIFSVFFRVGIAAAACLCK